MWNTIWTKIKISSMYQSYDRVFWSYDTVKYGFISSKWRRRLKYNTIDFKYVRSSLVKTVQGSVIL